MTNFDKNEIEVCCPTCDFYSNVTLKQIRLRDTVICRGCKATLNFNDYMDTLKKAIRKLNKVIDGLSKTFQ